MAVGVKKVLSGFSWVALIVYANRIFGFITTLILAKLLAPKDFGLVAIASMIIEILNLFKDMGLSEAIIYQKGDVQRSGSTAFILVVGLNLVLFAVASIIAPFASDFYENPMVLPIVILISSNLIWNSIRAVPYAIIRKNIDFRSLVLPDIFPVVLASVVSIVMAYLGYGVWSLVVRSILVSLLGMLLIWKYTDFKPTLKYDRAVAKELFSYGKFIVGTSIFLVSLYNIDKFYVSKFAGIAALGFFELAMRIANLPVSEFSHIVGSVMFPVFSKMSDQMDAMKNAFLKTLRYSSMISIPMAVGIAFFGPSLVESVYGDKWAPMTPLLQILAFYAMMRSISSIVYDSFKATGNPQVMQKFVILKLALVGAFGIPSLYLFDVEGICYVILGTYIIAFVFESITLARILKITVLSILHMLMFPLVNSFIIIPGIYYLVTITFGNQNLLPLIGGMISCVIVFLASIYVLDKPTVVEIRKILLSKS